MATPMAPKGKPTFFTLNIQHVLKGAICIKVIKPVLYYLMPTWLGQFDSFSNYKENDVKNKSKLLSR
jgi:hypothetical protein